MRPFAICITWGNPFPSHLVLSDPSPMGKGLVDTMMPWRTAFTLQWAAVSQLSGAGLLACTEEVRHPAGSQCLREELTSRAAWLLSRDLWSVVAVLFVITLACRCMKGGGNFLKVANILKAREEGFLSSC